MWSKQVKENVAKTHFNELRTNHAFRFFLEFQNRCDEALRYPLWVYLYGMQWFRIQFICHGGNWGSLLAHSFQLSNPGPYVVQRLAYKLRFPQAK